MKVNPSKAQQPIHVDGPVMYMHGGKTLSEKAILGQVLMTREGSNRRRPACRVHDAPNYTSRTDDDIQRAGICIYSDFCTTYYDSHGLLVTTHDSKFQDGRAYDHPVNQLLFKSNPPSYGV